MSSGQGVFVSLWAENSSCNPGFSGRNLILVCSKTGNDRCNFIESHKKLTRDKLDVRKSKILFFPMTASNMLLLLVSSFARWVNFLLNWGSCRNESFSKKLLCCTIYGTDSWHLWMVVFYTAKAIRKCVAWQQTHLHLWFVINEQCQHWRKY